jgi:5-enolpyruvylshikimate-3-phosphate synthase
MILQDTYEVKKADIIPVEVSVPGSKSITNRALLIAALANGKSVLKGVLFSDDSRHFLQALWWKLMSRMRLSPLKEKGAGFQRQKLPLMWEVQELLPVF